MASSTRRTFSAQARTPRKTPRQRKQRWELSVSVSASFRLQPRHLSKHCGTNKYTRSCLTFALQNCHYFLSDGNKAVTLLPPSMYWSCQDKSTEAFLFCGSKPCYINKKSSPKRSTCCGWFRRSCQSFKPVSAVPFRTRVSFLGAARPWAGTNPGESLVLGVALGSSPFANSWRVDDYCCSVNNF